MQAHFESPSWTLGIEAVDPIETRRFTVYTDTSVEPTSDETEGFVFPVDSACRICAASFELQHTVPVDVRSADGTHLASVSPPTNREFDAGEYLLDIHGPIKLYVRVESGFQVKADTNIVRIDFGTPTEMRVGARSYHSAPATTMTVPDDPEALMEAVSVFPSALKTTSPEQSWPTLRGHPPRIERGDSLDVPDGLEPPETGVTIEVPPEYGAIYTVAPLAFYLGADVVAGETARLRAESGVDVALGEDSRTRAESVEQVLKRVFVLDCVTRTEGYYPVELHECDVLESTTALDFEALYDAPIGERLTAYLGVPDARVESVLPTWHRVTHVRPDAEVMEMLSAIVDDLSLVRVNHRTDRELIERESEVREAIADVFRGPDEADSLGESGDGPSGVPDASEYVRVPDDEADAFERAWAGDGTMLHATKLLPDALARETPEPTDGIIDIAVVCNDAEMAEESDAVSDVYEGRENLHVTVDAQTDVSTGELRETVRSECDLFHFIGHIDGEGFECSDGVLDAETIGETGATAILLNGCRSYSQGRALVEAGADAAIASVGDVENQCATDIGEALARLLDHGFSVGTAVAIVDEYTYIGRDYLVLGDPSVTVSPCENGVPVMHHVTEFDGHDEVTVETRTYPNRAKGPGTIFQSYLPTTDSDYHIAVGTCDKVQIRKRTLRQKLVDDSEPLVADGELVWSDSWFDCD